VRGFRRKRLMSGRGNVRWDKKNEDGLTFSPGEKHIEEIFDFEKLLKVEKLALGLH
jgi:hypothetical protein